VPSLAFRAKTTPPKATPSANPTEAATNGDFRNGAMEDTLRRNVILFSIIETSDKTQLMGLSTS
jgi:hypothetical protein